MDVPSETPEKSAGIIYQSIICFMMFYESMITNVCPFLDESMDGFPKPNRAFTLSCVIAKGYMYVSCLGRWAGLKFQDPQGHPKACQ